MSENKPINFCCVFYGNKYEIRYVQHLYNMVKRNLTIPFNFIVFTDHVKLAKLLVGDITVKQFKRHDFEGWWNKIQLFSPESELEGVNFYLDLDVVILDNIDCFIEWGDDKTFGITNDFGQPNNWYNSSVMKFNNEVTTPAIWDKFMSDRVQWLRLQGDQNVITELMRKSDHLKPFPDDWTFSYKWFSRKVPRFSKQKWTFEKDPKAKIAVFHGHPNPHESDQDWVKSNWK